MLKKLSNKSEMEVHEQVVSAADIYGASVYRKIRVADVIDIEQLATRHIGTYALQAHFDFVVADAEAMPLFAIEYDGPGHDSKNDGRKDVICQQAGLALFRIGLQSSRAETARMGFVCYLVNLWFLAAEFAEMQRRGELLSDEPFMMSGFLKPNARNIFDSEFNLLGLARGKLNHYCEQNGVLGGPLWHMHVSTVLFMHDAGDFVAFSSLKLHEEVALCGLKLGQFMLCGRALIGLKIPYWGQLAEVPFSHLEMGQFCTALAIEDMIEELTLFQAGGGHVMRRPEDVLQEVDELGRAGYKMITAFGEAGNEFAQAINVRWLLSRAL